MLRLVSSGPPTRCHVLAPGARRKTPKPLKFSNAVFASPRPTHTDPSSGSVASAPIESRGRPVDHGVQWAPPSVDFHTPPSAPPAKIAPPAEVSALMRPVTRPSPEPKLLQIGSW